MISLNLSHNINIEFFNGSGDNFSIDCMDTIGFFYENAKRLGANASEIFKMLSIINSTDKEKWARELDFPIYGDLGVERYFVHVHRFVDAQCVIKRGRHCYHLDRNGVEAKCIDYSDTAINGYLDAGVWIEFLPRGPQ